MSHPLDVVRIRQQSEVMGAGRAGGVGRGASGLPSSTIWRSLVDMVRLEGPRSLLRGASAPVAACALQNAVIFHAYGRVAEFLGGDVFSGRAAAERPERPEGASETAAAAGAVGVCSPSSPGSSVPEVAVSNIAAAPESASDPRAWAALGESGLPPAGLLLHAGAAGVFAGCVQSAIAAPVELVKIRLQLSRDPGTSDAAAVHKLFADDRARWEGERERRSAEKADGRRTTVRGRIALQLSRVYVPRFLFRGFAPTLVRDSISFGVYFVAFEASRGVFAAALAGPARSPRPHLRSADPGAEESPTPRCDSGDSARTLHGGSGDSAQTVCFDNVEFTQTACRNASTPPQTAASRPSSLLATFLAGSVAGVACWVASYPADVVKTRMQGGETSAASSSALAVARDILRNEGWRAMFAGLGATVCRAAVANAVIFTVYEGAHAALGGTDA